MSSKLSFVVIIAVILQNCIAIGEDVEETYLVMRSTIRNAAMQGLQTLRHLEQDDEDRTINDIINAMKDNMAHEYDDKLSAMETVVGNCTNRGVNIAECLRTYQYIWLQVWVVQTAAAEQISAESRLHSSELIRTYVGSIQESYGTIFEYEKQIAECMNTTPSETCATKLIEDMKTDMQVVPERIYKSRNGIKGILTSAMTATNHTLSVVQTTLTLAGEEIIRNLTDCVTKT